MEKLRGALLFSVIVLSMFVFTEIIKPVEAAYPFGTHRIYFNYYGTDLAYDHDGDIWPFTNEGEWYFRLYYDGYYRWSPEYKVDKDRNGWKYINHVDLIEQNRYTPQTYQLWAGEDDPSGWDYTREYWTSIPSNWGYYSQYRPRQYHYRDQRVGDVWFNWYYYIYNDAPTVNYISGYSSGYRKVAYTFTVSSSDPEGDSMTYDWKVDGALQSTTGPSLTYTFPTSASLGTHSISVRAKDYFGLYSSWETKTFTIVNRAPTVGAISGPSSGYPGVPYTYHTTGSDPDGDAITYQWQVNGTTQPATGSSMTYTFPTAGTYIVRVRAKDSYNAYSSYSSKTVMIRLGGDVNGDGDVDHKDLLLLASAYGSEVGDPNYIPEADMDGDGKVDHKDLLILAANYGKGT